MEEKGLLSKKWFFLGLFVFLFSYAIIRAWTVVPMLDELATFYSYIRTGHYFNTIELLDANNHLLNSFFGHQMYRLFGDHFFLFRISSLLAFPIYFFSAKYIVRASSIPKPINLLVFLSLVCIPWVFEYFSYSRGYGTATAFYFAAIAFFIKWKGSAKHIHFALVFCCLWLTVVSSLTYLFPSLLFFLYAAFISFLKQGVPKKRFVPTTTVLIVWLMALSPFVRYSFELKAAGALWWGNQNGLWESTGKSLSRLVLFNDGEWIVYLISALLLFGTISFFVSWIKSGFWDYLKHTEAMIFIFLIGGLIGIVVMRYLFDVNYPMDRVGMYLVPLFILFLGLFLSKYHFSKYGAIALSFIPISFIFHLNLSTSIFSPEDRIPTYLSKEIKSNLKDDTALSAEYVSHMSYAYSCRKDKKVHIAFTAEQIDRFLGDYHINWLGRYSRNGYSIDRQDAQSRTRILKRKEPISKTVVVDTLIENIEIRDMYFSILDRPIDSLLQSKKMQVEISGVMDFDQPTSSFNIIQSIGGEDKNAPSNSSPHFGWYFSDRTDINFVFVDRVFQLKPEDRKFNFFLLNGDKIKIKIKQIHVRIYLIDD